MHHLLRISNGIDRLNRIVGKSVSWLTLAMILIGAFNAVARYLGKYLGASLSSNAYIELQWYLFSLVFLLGAAYTLQQNAHVRVDVFYERLSSKGKAWLNLIGALFLAIPFCTLLIWSSWDSVIRSWSIKEISPDPGGLPRYPIKAAVPIAFLLLILQAISEAVKSLIVIRKHEVTDAG